MKYLIGIIVVILVLGGIWTFSPALYDNEVHEALPEIQINDKAISQKKEVTYPITLKSGHFYSTDVQSSGTIKILDYGDKKILRIENLSTSNGPDLNVYLGTNSDLKNESDLHAGKLKIAALQANKGSQNYTLPEGINIDKYNSVAIHCRAYDHAFAFGNIK